MKRGLTAASQRKSAPSSLRIDKACGFAAHFEEKSH
jgi:hypothetical protein